MLTCDYKSMTSYCKDYLHKVLLTKMKSNVFHSLKFHRETGSDSLNVDEDILEDFKSHLLGLLESLTEKSDYSENEELSDLFSEVINDIGEYYFNEVLNELK